MNRINVREFINDKTKKYVLVLGEAGYGDRIQVLLEAIEYCKKTGRYLVVNWNDQIWNENGKHDFYHYFSFTKDVKSIHFLDFFTILRAEQRNRDFTIFPTCWNREKDKLMSVKFNSKIYYNQKYNSFINNKSVQNIINNKTDDFCETLVIFPGNGLRTYSYRFFNKIILNQKYREKIQNEPDFKNICQEPYICIHLRGTDRSLKSKFNNNSNNADEYVNSILNKILMRKNKNIKTFFICCDDNKLLDTFKKNRSEIAGLSGLRFYYHIEFLSKIKDVDIKQKGIHNIDEESLFKEGITKQDINYYTILDFVIMINSEEVISDGTSLYSNMAKSIKKFSSNGLI